LKKKIISFITATENINNFYFSNKFLIDELLKKFTDVYILNLHYLKILTKKKNIINTKFPKNINIIIFKSSDEFKKFNIYHEIISILDIGKDLSFFKIHYLLKKFNIKLIMIMNFSQIGNKMTIDLNWKYLFKAYKNYYNKGFYHLFRILTIINIFPKIDLLFESNLEIINYIKNSRSKRIENLLPFLRISYFKEVIPINSVYFDYFNILKNNKIPKRKHLVYIDTHFDHEDRTSREGSVRQADQDIFYNNLSSFLKEISYIYKKPVIISKHPNNKSIHKFYKSFEISKVPTYEAIYDSEIAIFTVSSAILNAVILKKKIINISSKLLGDYFNNIGKQYVKSLGILTFNIDNNLYFKKKILDTELDQAIKNYNIYISTKLMIDKKNSPFKKITETINKKFFYFNSQ
jgi:hypothetical protein